MFEQVGQGCYWFGGEELTYTEAVAACLGHGSTLLTLPAPGTQLDLLLARLRSGQYPLTQAVTILVCGQ